MTRRPRPIQSLVLVLLMPAVMYCRDSAPPVPGGDKQEAPSPEQTTEPHGSQTVGAIQVTGETSDWFEVLQDGKRMYEGAPPLLNKALEVPPGTYEVVVNKTKRTVQVEAGKKLVLSTGTLVVEGQQSGFYAPYQGEERKVTGNPRILNAPMALFSGTYRVELNAGVKGQAVLSDSAQVTAGKRTVLRE